MDRQKTVEEPGAKANSKRVRLDVNRLVRGKVKQDHYWLHTNFHTETVTVSALAGIIQAGMAYTSAFAKVPDDKHKTCHFKENVEGVSLLWLDAESEDERSTLDYWQREPFVRDYGAILHTTASHTPDKPRSRVLFVLEEPLTVEEGEAALKALFWHYSHVDQDVHDAGRVLYGAPDCDMVVMPNVLPFDVLDERIVEPYKNYLEAERRRLEEAREDTLARQKRTSGNASSSQIAKYVEKTRDAILGKLANAKEGTGERHEQLKKSSVRLYSLQKALWLDEDARALLDDIENDILAKTRANGYLAKYGEHDVRRHVRTGELIAQPAHEPAWTPQPDFFEKGDFVQCDLPGRQDRGHVSAVKKLQDAWQYKVNGVWWPQCALQHAIEPSVSANGSTNAPNVKPQTPGDVLSEETPPPPPNWDEPTPDKPPPEERPAIEAKDELVEAFFEHAKGKVCTCTNKGSYVDIHLKHTSVQPNSNNDRRECPYHRHKSAYRFTRQVEAEQKRQEKLTLSKYKSEADWTRTRKRWNKRKERGEEAVAFRPFFQQDGSVEVIHSCEDEPGEVLPEEKVEILEVITGILENEHESRRSRASKDFGGQYSGTRGNSGDKDSEKYALQCNVSASRLAQEAFSVKTNTFGYAKVERDCVSVFCNLADYKAKKHENGYDIELEERWPQGMENEVARTIYNDEIVKEVLAEYSKLEEANAYSVSMSSLTHNTTNTLLCNKDDIQEEQEQLTLVFETPVTDEGLVVEPTEQPPPAHAPPEREDILDYYLETMRG